MLFLTCFFPLIWFKNLIILIKMHFFVGNSGIDNFLGSKPSKMHFFGWVFRLPTLVLSVMYSIPKSQCIHECRAMMCAIYSTSTQQHTSNWFISQNILHTYFFFFFFFFFFTTIVQKH